MPSLFALLSWFHGWAVKTAKAPTRRWCFDMVGFFAVMAGCTFDAAVPAINAGAATELTCP
jgi:hypothetical protein